MIIAQEVHDNHRTILFKIKESLLKFLFIVLLYTNHYCMCFTNTNLLNPHNDPKYLYIYSWEHSLNALLNVVFFF